MTEAQPKNVYILKRNGWADELARMLNIWARSYGNADTLCFVGMDSNEELMEAIRRNLVDLVIVGALEVGWKEVCQTVGVTQAIMYYATVDQETKHEIDTLGVTSLEIREENSVEILFDTVLRKLAL